MDSSKPSLTYRDAGVDIDAGNTLVERIKPHAQRTKRPEMLSGLGASAHSCRSRRTTKIQYWYPVQMA